MNAPLSPAPAGLDKSLSDILLEAADVVVRRRKMIAWTVAAATTLAVLLALVLPKWYKATASVFPADQANLLAGLDGISSLAKSFGGGGRSLGSLTGPTEEERYLAILKSETALMKVIEKFDLQKVYDITRYPRSETIKELLSNVDFRVADEGNVEIAVYDKDPQRAADMANYFVDVLNETNSQLQAQNARGSREFIEQRYNENMAEIRRGEEAMLAFQLKHGVIAMPEQTEASIKAGAEMYAQLASKEIEYNVLRRSLGPDHPSTQSMAVEVAEIRKMLRAMSLGTRDIPGEMKILVPFNKTPELSAQYIRLFRDVEIQYKILQFIAPLYEQAKVEEKRSTPSVIVLDRAVLPERKAKPKILIYALVGFVVSSLVSLLAVFLAEAVARIRSRDPERFASIVRTARADWFGLRVPRSRLRWK